MSRWVPLALAYLVTRLYQLALLPLFVDEAVHLRWTVRLVEEGRLGRILVDGKLLQVVLMSVTVPWVSNPAWWGRATTVAVGALGLWTTCRIGERLFGPERRLGGRAPVRGLPVHVFLRPNGTGGRVPRELRGARSLLEPRVPVGPEPQEQHLARARHGRERSIEDTGRADPRLSADRSSADGKAEGMGSWPRYCVWPVRRARPARSWPISSSAPSSSE